MSFVPLHVHTEYSLLDGSNKIKEYVARVAELGMNAAAITDHGVMYGCIDFYKAAKNAGIKPIIGCEVYVSSGSRFDKEGGNHEDKYYHLILLAENNEGYHNLMKIVSAGFVEGFYYKPRVDKEILQKYHEGIIASSACLAGEIDRALLRGNYEEAKKIALEYRDIFGEGNFFLELMDHGIAEQQFVNQQLIRMSEELGIELIATNDTHYTYKEDAEPHDLLLCIQTQKLVTDENRMRYTGGQYYLKSEEEMRALFSHVPQAVENTQKIADRCNVDIVFHEKKLPRFDVPEGWDAYDYLETLCRRGLAERYASETLQSAKDERGVTAVYNAQGNEISTDPSVSSAEETEAYKIGYEAVGDDLKSRLQEELDTIRGMGFVDYFLIVWDFIKYSRDNGIIVGPGRGSAAGSVVSYTLGITQLDPLKYNLLFERFLNPERVTMPDIDVDFCYERRQEVIDYVVRKYGKKKTVQIITFGTLAAKGVIRDVGRVLDMPYAQCDEIAKMIPNELNMTLDKALEMNPELKAKYDGDEQVHYLIDMSRRLEGLPRHTSMHAAGVLICQDNVDEYVPLSVASDGTITTQYTMVTLEELGLLKMDFLGLRTLTIIQTAERLVNEGKKAAAKDQGIEDVELLDINDIDYNDKKVLGMISKGQTQGVFQLESEGMKNFMKELKPENLEEIIAGISLYRPGPMDFIPRYLQGKKDAASIVYDCKEIEPILKPTHGCIVYQEQVMQIVRDLGGYTLGRSDLVRRAMSKKKADVMARERQNFVYGNKEEGVPGCISRGISETVANKIFDEMTDFAKYAFNKSHAAAYAYVSFQTAYLKYYYPVEFMAALMTCVIDFPDKCAEYILHCHAMNIEILPPDVNKSKGSFSVEDGKIRYGLYAIKSVGHGVIDTMVAERENAGEFSSLKDLLERTFGKEMNKRAIENMIKAGAMDCLDGNRKQKLVSYTMMLDDIAKERKASISGQLSLFDFMAPQDKAAYTYSMPNLPELSKEDKLAYEKDVLGIYLSGHPLEEDEQFWKSVVTAKSTDFAAVDEDHPSVLIGGERKVIGGMIASKTVKYTKNNKAMAFIQIEDLVGSAEVIVFPKVYEQFSQLLIEDTKVFVYGRVSLEEDRASKLICDNIIRFDDMARQVWLQFKNKDDYSAAEKEIEELVYEGEPEGNGEFAEPAKDHVVIYIKEGRSMKRLPKRVTLTKVLLEKLSDRFGSDNVKVTKL